jgi:hypothetical protein
MIGLVIVEMTAEVLARGDRNGFPFVSLVGWVERQRNPWPP